MILLPDQWERETGFKVEHDGGKAVGRYVAFMLGHMDIYHLKTVIERKT